MSTPIKQTLIQFGRETRRDFNLSCQPLDWQPIDVTFPTMMSLRRTSLRGTTPDASSTMAE